MSSKPLALSYIYLIISAILFGFLVFGGKVMSEFGLSLMEIIIIPNTIVSIALVYFVKKDIKKFYSFPWWIIVCYPLVCALCQVGQYAPLFMEVSVSLVVLLLYTQPIWTILISTIFFKTKLGKQELATLIILMTGLLILLAPWKDISYSINGVILALMGGLCLSAWVTFNSYFSKNGLKPVSLTFFSNLYTSIPFVLAYPIIAKIIDNSQIVSFSLEKPIFVIIGIFLYSIIIFIGANLLFYKASQKINCIHLGLILLLEPLVGAILDITFLKTPITWNIIVGGLLIILSNANIIIRGSKENME